MGACSSAQSKTAARPAKVPAVGDSFAAASPSLISASNSISEKQLSPPTVSSPSQSIKSQGSEQQLKQTSKRPYEMTTKTSCSPKKPKPLALPGQTKSRIHADKIQFVDNFFKFILAGGHIGDLIDEYPPPQGWNEKLTRSYPVQCRSLQTNGNQSLYQIIIHLNDSEVSTKRQFLAFYQIDLHKMDPQDFAEWCQRNKMYNTLADYIALYVESRYHGQGSRYLRGLVNDKRALKIEMTDRFHTSNGVFRAIVFQASTVPAAYHLVNSYLQRLKPADYRSVRCSLPDPLEVFRVQRNIVRSEGMRLKA